MTSDSATLDHTEEDGNKIQAAEVAGVRNALISSPGSEKPYGVRRERDHVQTLFGTPATETVMEQRVPSSATNKTASTPTPSDPHHLAVRSAELITSSATLSALAAGQTQSVQIVTAISTVKATASAAAQDGSMPVDTKIALGVGIPVGVILIIVLIIGGFMLGRRPAKREKKSTVNMWRRLWRKTGEKKQDAEIQDPLCLLASQEKHELPGDRAPGELATTYNIQELPEERRLVELPQTSPVEVPRRSPVELE